jgi:AcrR family transcriptional regulator
MVAPEISHSRPGGPLRKRSSEQRKPFRSAVAPARKGNDTRAAPTARALRERLRPGANGEASAHPTSTRNKILDAAMRHFADVGLAHASVRAITKLAGVNSALIRYHFGSKQALYEEVIHKITKRLIQVRLDSLQLLKEEYASIPIPIEKLLHSYAKPVLPRSGDDLSQDAAIYLRFFGRVYTEPSDELRGMIQSHFTDLQRRYIDELRRCLPQISHETIIFRFGMLIGSLTFLGAKMGIIGLLSDGRLDENDSQMTLSQFVTSFTNLFRTSDPRPLDRGGLG